MQAISPVLSLSPSSPSFNTYSTSPNLAEIAARVVEEFSKDSDWDDGEYVPSLSAQQHEIEDGDGNNRDDHRDVDDDREEEEDGEFEFPSVSRKTDSSSISADEIFFNGQIKPVYPLFDTDLLLNAAVLGGPYLGGTTTTTTNTAHFNNNNSSSSNTDKPKTRRSPLRKLMNEERETMTSCSSSESDDLDNLQPGTYCVWNPQNASSGRHHHQESNSNNTPERCKKSNSAGSNSRRWKFRDFLHRSNSDPFLSLSSSNSKKSGGSARKVAADTHEVNHREADIKEKEAGTPTKTATVEAKCDDNNTVKVVEEHCATKNRAAKEEDKRKSYLPYRQDLVGFINNVNGLSRNLHFF